MMRMGYGGGGGIGAMPSSFGGDGEGGGYMGGGGGYGRGEGYAGGGGGGGYGGAGGFYGFGYGAGDMQMGPMMGAWGGHHQKMGMQDSQGTKMSMHQHGAAPYPKPRWPKPVPHNYNNYNPVRLQNWRGAMIMMAMMMTKPRTVTVT